MANAYLNPAWFNALVDDDGSNVIGTVWNKPQIQGLLTTIDNELAGLATAVWTPTLVGAGGGVPSYTMNRATWARAYKACLFSGRTQLSSKGTLAGGLSWTGFPYTFDGDQALGTIGFYSGLIPAGTSLSLYGTNGSNVLYIARTASGYTTQLTAADLGAGVIDLWFTGSAVVL